MSIADAIEAPVAGPVSSGEGLPNGGTDGQVLTKQSATDGDADWETPVGGGGGAADNFTFAASGVQSGNRYTDWSDLIDALATATDPTVRVEGTIAAPAVVPAGAWDLNGAGFVGNGSLGHGFNEASVLKFSDGATITNPGRRIAQGGIILYSVSTSNVLVLSGKQSIYFDDDAYGVAIDAAFARITTGAIVVVRPGTGSGFRHASTTGLAGADAEFLDVEAGGQAHVAFATGNTVMDDDTVKGAGTVILAVISPAGGVDNPFGPPTGLSHVNASGIVGPLYFSRADQIHADNANGLVSTEVQGQLDELAGRTAVVEQLWANDGVLDGPTTHGIADTDTAAGDITIDFVSFTTAKRRVTMFNTGATDDLILDNITVSGVANPVIGPNQSRTIYRTTGGLNLFESTP